MEHRDFGTERILFGAEGLELEVPNLNLSVETEFEVESLDFEGGNLDFGMGTEYEV